MRVPTFCCSLFEVGESSPQKGVKGHYRGHSEFYVVQVSGRRSLLNAPCGALGAAHLASFDIPADFVWIPEVELSISCGFNVKGQPACQTINPCVWTKILRSSSKYTGVDFVSSVPVQENHIEQPNLAGNLAS